MATIVWIQRGNVSAKLSGVSVLRKVCFSVTRPVKGLDTEDIQCMSDIYVTMRQRKTSSITGNVLFMNGGFSLKNSNIKGDLSVSSITACASIHSFEAFSKKLQSQQSWVWKKGVRAKLWLAVSMKSSLQGFNYLPRSSSDFTLLSFIPARCWMAPEIPTAMYNSCRHQQTTCCASAYCRKWCHKPETRQPSRNPGRSRSRHTQKNLTTSIKWQNLVQWASLKYKNILEAAQTTALEHHGTNFNKLVLTNGKIQFGRWGDSEQTPTALWL